MKKIFLNQKFVTELTMGVKTIEFNFYCKKTNLKEIISIENTSPNKVLLKKNLKTKINNQIIFQISVDSNIFIYGVINNNRLLVFKETRSYEYCNALERKNTIKNFNDKIRLTQTSFRTYAVIESMNGKNETVKILNEILSNKKQNEWLDYDLGGSYSEKMVTLSYLKTENSEVFITYFPQRKKLHVAKLSFEVNDKRIKNIEFLNKNEIKMSIFKHSFQVNFRKAKKNKIIVCKNKKILNSNELISIIINRDFFYLFQDDKNLVMFQDITKTIVRTSALRSLFIFDKLVIWGTLKFDKNLNNGVMDYLYVKDKEDSIGKFNRLKSFVWLFIDVRRLAENDSLHRGLNIGSEKNIRLPLMLNNSKIKEEFFVFAQRKYKDSVIMLRKNIGDGTSFTKLPYSEEYSFYSKLKMKLAYVLSRIIKNKSKVVLYFEKKSEKADESAIHVFDRVMNTRDINSKNFFILDKNAEVYKELKLKYNKNLVRKYSLKYYYLIYISTYFVSSELSNHLVNDRFFINRLKTKIVKTPLLFLQHGIMFAKPIDNPMAKGFNKLYLGCNVVKTVISSELEAQEFYKVNYQKEDLLLSGLATFDYAKLNETANKIAYMPTYRYWEEHLIYNNRIKETTYYKDLLNMLELFESNNMLESFILIPHNKFADYILKEFPKYQDNINTNPSKALKDSLIFITDYSSAIYDAIIRGAYPIFYWKHKNNLIENYKAVPPVNEENAPGPVIIDDNKLITEIKRVIQNKYFLEEEYTNKYSKINCFDDGENTSRILNYLLTEKKI